MLPGSFTSKSPQTLTAKNDLLTFLAAGFPRQGLMLGLKLLVFLSPPSKWACALPWLLGYFKCAESRKKKKSQMRESSRLGTVLVFSYRPNRLPYIYRHGTLKVINPIWVTAVKIG